jgi:NADPH:quinone reductase-like Zn-dependent oxidoreductase
MKAFVVERYGSEAGARMRQVPDLAFAREINARPVVRLATMLLSARTKLRARRLHVGYAFLFMRASGKQLRAITALVDAGTIRPVVDRVFSFESIEEAMA